VEAVMDINTKQGMAAAKAWTEQLLSTIKDQGVWAVPRSGSIIRFDKTNKKALVIHQMSPDIPIERVLEARGWEIIYKNSAH
jgi:hypothetical protein